MNDLTPPPPAHPAASLTALRAALGRSAFLFVGGREMRALLDEAGGLEGLEAFAASWNDLEVDGHMADQGRYRRRRHGVFEADADGRIVQRPARPHYQSRDYNPLNGGIERWFAPLSAQVSEGPVLASILRLCYGLFTDPGTALDRWAVEVHQFRIEARADAPGRPTPEGMHRDGVDHVLVLMIRRVNIASGTTTIRSSEDRLLDSFTLTDPLDAAILDDRKVYHGVTTVQPIDPKQPAYRDVLVVTFRKVAEPH